MRQMRNKHCRLERKYSVLGSGAKMSSGEQVRSSGTRWQEGGQDWVVSGKKYCSGADMSHPVLFCCLLHWSLPQDQMLRTCRDIREELPE